MPQITYCSAGRGKGRGSNHPAHPSPRGPSAASRAPAPPLGLESERARGQPARESTDQDAEVRGAVGSVRGPPPWPVGHLEGAGRTGEQGRCGRGLRSQAARGPGQSVGLGQAWTRCPGPREHHARQAPTPWLPSELHDTRTWSGPTVWAIYATSPRPQASRQECTRLSENPAVDSRRWQPGFRGCPRGLRAAGI